MEIKVLFVCLGNICRSPMAEGVFKQMLNAQGLTDKISCDSAGTSRFHTGELADPRMRQTAENHDIALVHRARQIQKDDLEKFDWIIAMDDLNLRDIKTLHREPLAEIRLLRSFGDSQGDMNVPDPYYGEEDGFEEVFQVIHYHCEAFLNHLIISHQW